MRAVIRQLGGGERSSPGRVRGRRRTGRREKGKDDHGNGEERYVREKSRLVTYKGVGGVGRGVGAVGTEEEGSDR